MALTMVSSTLPVAVLCTGTTHPVGVDPEMYDIQGTRGPDAVNGVGITYDVDATCLSEFLAGNPDIAAQMKAITQADLDALIAAAGEYGFQVGLTPEGLEALNARMTLEDTRAAAAAAAGRRREAEGGRRQAALLRRQAEALDEQSKVEIDAAEAAQKAAADALAAKTPSPPAEAARPTPTPTPPARAATQPARDTTDKSR